MSDFFKRREAIKKVALILGAGTLAPSLIGGILSGCQADTTPDWRALSLNNSEVSLVKAWIDVIIPETETPSASQLLVHRFIDRMIGEFLLKEDITTIKNGVKHLENNNFIKIMDEKKIEMISEMSKSEMWQPFFLLMKSMILLGYFTSETGATKVLNYDPIPGDYEPCIPIDKYHGKIWAT